MASRTLRGIISVSGGPQAGEIMEVDEPYASVLVETGRAEDLSELATRLGTEPENRYVEQTKGDLKEEARKRGLTVGGSKDELVDRLLKDDEAPVDSIDEEVAELVEEFEEED